MTTSPRPQRPPPRALRRRPADPPPPTAAVRSTAPRPCEQCGTIMRRGRDSLTNWTARRFCSRACSSASRIRFAGVTLHCAQCGVTLPRPRGTTSARWARRVYCSPACRVAGLRLPPLDARGCRICGAPLRRSPSEGAPKWRARQYCSPACVGVDNVRRHAATRAARPTRTCEHCGAAYSRRRQGETIGQFGQRRFCSNRCSVTGKRRGTACERSPVVRCRVPECGMPLSDPSTERCTEKDNPACWRRRQEECG